ncbi:uncharacterized protein LOC129596938 [Paramacrobiotus metropolitanus]|uniref:uncharacterized protein LOC129596938 n=1 Tax=Paramacrobiotus metropolitanus TaxID=2943436 RepID=UPI002445BD8A|nr:uncharacterized protein LOC129596938 [Paramacrobiotus metropolitanus]
MIASCINLSVFARWKRKEPFLLFHISLSFAELLCSTTSFVGYVNRAFDYTLRYALLSKIGIGFRTTFLPLINILVMLISVDRWISVQFPLFYRRKVKRRVILLTINLVWTGTCGFYVIFFAFMGSSVLVVTCREVGQFVLKDPAWIIFYNIQFFSTLVLIALPQCHTCAIALQVKCRAHHRRQNTRDNDSRLVRSAIRSAMAGSAVVITNVVCQSTARLIYFFGMRSGVLTVGMAIAFTSFDCLKYLMPFVCYVAFFPKFRNNLLELIYGRRQRIVKNIVLLARPPNYPPNN